MVQLFTSPACNPADTLVTKSPGDVVLLEREIEAAREGIRTRSIAGGLPQPPGRDNPCVEAQHPLRPRQIP